MTTSGITDFGTQLYTATLSGSVVGSYSQLAEVTKIKFGAVKVETIDLTSHQSTGGYTELKPSGKKSIGEMELTCNFTTASAVNVFKNDMDAGTEKSYKMIFSTSASLIFTGFPTEWQLAEADAQSPAGLTFDVKVQPSNTFTLS
jgi:hypothetical protein